MSEIKCCIIKDMIPLYVDNVLSEESKAIFDKHISTCRSCKKELDLMNQSLVIPIDANTAPLNKIKHKIAIKQRITTGIYVCLILATCSFLYWFLTQRTTPIPYNEDTFSIDQIDESFHIQCSTGLATEATLSEPIDIVIDAKEQTVVFVQFSETFRSKHEAPLDATMLKENNDFSETEIQNIIDSSLNVEIENIQDLDAIYYTHDTNYFKLRNNSNDSNDSDALNNSTLLWNNPNN